MDWLTVALVLLFALFVLSLPFWILHWRDRKAPVADTLYSFKTESHVTFPWGRIWVYDSHPHASNLPTVVFIHSIGSSIYSWRYQLPEFQKKYRVVAFDLMGFGKSDKPLSQSYGLDAQEERIISLLDHLKIKRCALVGCSLGGALSLWLASRNKERFPFLAVIAPAAVSSLVPFFLVKPAIFTLLASKIISRRIIRIALENGYANKKNITPEVIENYYSPFNDPNGTSCFLRTVETIRDGRIFKSLPSIASHTLILWGEHDRVVQKADMERICKEIPDAKIERHPMGGHHLMEDEPAWVNERIMKFLDEGHYSDVATVPSQDLV